MTYLRRAMRIAMPFTKIETVGRAWIPLLQRRPAKEKNRVKMSGALKNTWYARHWKRRSLGLNHQFARRGQCQIGIVALDPINVPLQARHVYDVAVVVVGNVLLIDGCKGVDFGFRPRHPAR